MPTYVYKFIDSGETIEVVQSFDEATLTEARHPVSGRLEAVKKVFMPVGVTFRGGGFYRTDSRNGSSKRSSSRDGDGSSAASTNGSSASSSSTSSDKTPAASSSASSSSG